MEVNRPANPSDLFSAKDLVIVITGGGSGIGLAFASALARNGASRIFLLGRRLPPLEKARSDFGDSIIPVQADVASSSSLSSAVQTISSQTPYIDVLINNAGVTGPTHTDLYNANSIDELSQMMLSQQEKWASTYEINTTAVVTVSGAFLPLLHAGNVRKGWPAGRRTIHKREKVPEGIDADDLRTSQIITVASISAFNREVTAGLAYTASKAGAVLLGKSMAHFLAGWGIRSNMIAPGRFPSEMTAGGQTEFGVDKVPASVPGRFEDMAGTILYTVGKAGQYLNGNVQVLDGGRLSVMPGTY
ncbi:Rhamnolipids biosynthesis 3-oxoacyl [Elsinoe australis]|uniref:Rhamnolipids biosynthesis 3-oxoacyl n=1 Tax=Elsinoe australis TaxID=40998 RepID=A0A2P7ZCV9_9PEZI|nr:Rhamnolipids biosynthesis 3-oxoacyl [Elsinoe australis]